MATLYPALARQWHPTKNGGLTPAAVAPGSRRRVWWQCPQGHTWQAAVFSRSQGADCPVCTGRTVLPGENDLATVFPQLARQWDQERNGALTPQQVSPYSNRAVWWRCGLGHSWHAAISTRAWGSDCPYCAGRKVLAGFNDLVPRAGPDVGPCPERSLDPGHGHPGKPQEGVVAVPGEPRVESRGLLPHQRQTLRLSGVCREGQPEESGAVPGSPCSGRGGESAGVNPQRASRGWKPKQCNQRRRQKI